MKLFEVLSPTPADAVDNPSVVYKVSLTAGPEVYYGYITGNNSQDTLDKIKKHFISGRTLDEDPKTKDRGDRRMMVAAGNDPKNLEFDIIEELPSEAQAKDARNEFRSSDPNTVARATSWPIRGISGQTLKSDPTFTKMRKLKKSAADLTAQKYAHEAGRAGDHSVRDMFLKRVNELPANQRFQFTSDQSSLTYPRFMAKYFPKQG